MARATSSLPVPLSPDIGTLTYIRAALSMRLNTFCMGSEFSMIPYALSGVAAGLDSQRIERFFREPVTAGKNSSAPCLTASTATSMDGCPVIMMIPTSG
jgi:hypothetical protein